MYEDVAGGLKAPNQAWTSTLQKITIRSWILNLISTRWYTQNIQMMTALPNQPKRRRRIRKRRAVAAKRRRAARNEEEIPLMKVMTATRIWMTIDGGKSDIIDIITRRKRARMRIVVVIVIVIVVKMFGWRNQNQ